MTYLSNIGGIEYGSAQIPTRPKEGYWSFIDIKYSKTYKNIPYVFINHYHTNIQQTAVTVVSLSNDGFSCGAYNINNYVDIAWVAIVYK